MYLFLLRTRIESDITWFDGGSSRLGEFLRAVRAELVGFDDFLFAVGAAGVEVAFAVGAEVEAGADGFTALRTWIGQRLAHEQIDQEAEKGKRRQKNNNEQCPKRGIHATALRVAVDVGDQENKNRDEERHTGNDSRQGHRSECEVVTQFKRKSLAIVSGVPSIHGKRDALRDQEQRNHGPNHAVWNDAKLFPEAEVFLFAAKPNKT